MLMVAAKELVVDFERPSKQEQLLSNNDIVTTASTIMADDEDGDSDIFVSSDEEVDDSEDRGTGLYGAGGGETHGFTKKSAQNNPVTKMERHLSKKHSREILQASSHSLVSDIISTVTSGASSQADESQVSLLIEQAMAKMRADHEITAEHDCSEGDVKTTMENSVATMSEAVDAMQEQVDMLLSSTNTTNDPGITDTAKALLQHQTLEMIKKQLDQLQRRQDELMKQQLQQKFGNPTHDSIAAESGPTEADTMDDTTFGTVTQLPHLSTKNGKPSHHMKFSGRNDEKGLPPMHAVLIEEEDPMEVNTVVQQARDVMDEDSIAVAMLAGAKAAASANNEAEELYISEKSNNNNKVEEHYISEKFNDNNNNNNNNNNEVESILDDSAGKKESQPAQRQDVWVCPGCQMEHAGSQLKFCGMCGSARPQQEAALPKRCKTSDDVKKSPTKFKGPPRRRSQEYSKSPMLPSRKSSKEYSKSPLSRAASDRKMPPRVPSRGEYRKTKSFEESPGKINRPGMKKARSKSVLMDSPGKAKRGEDSVTADTSRSPSRPGVKKRRSKSKLIEDSPGKDSKHSIPRRVKSTGDSSITEESMFSEALELALINNAAAKLTDGAEIKTTGEIHAEHHASKPNMADDSSDASSHSGSSHDRKARIEKKKKKKKSSERSAPKTPRSMKKRPVTRSTSGRITESKKSPHRSKRSPSKAHPRRTKSSPDEDLLNKSQGSSPEPISRGRKSRDHSKKEHRHGRTSLSRSASGKRKGNVRVESPKQSSSSPVKEKMRSSSPKQRGGIFGMAGAMAGNMAGKITKTPGRIKQTLNMSALTSKSPLLDDESGIHRHIGELKVKPKGIPVLEPDDDDDDDDDDVSVDDGAAPPRSRADSEESTIKNPATFVKDMKKKTDMWKKLFQKSTSTRDVMKSAHEPGDLGRSSSHNGPSHRARRASLGGDYSAPARGSSSRRSLVSSNHLESSTSDSGSYSSNDSGDSEVDLSPERELRPRRRRGPPPRAKSSDCLGVDSPAGGAGRRGRQMQKPKRDWNRRRRGSVERRGVSSNDMLKQSLAQLPDDPTHAIRDDLKQEWAKQDAREGLKSKADQLRQRFQKAGSSRGLGSSRGFAPLTPNATKAKAQIKGLHLSLDDDDVDD